MTKHISIEQILDYMQTPEDHAFKSLRMHLLSCLECRQKADELSQLLVQLPAIVPYLKQETVELSDELVHLIDNADQAQIKNRLLKLLEQEPRLLKSALYYALNSRNSLESELSEDITRQDGGAEQTSFNNVSRLKNLLSMKAPVWMSIPTAVAAGIIIAVLAYIMPTQQKSWSTVSIATYQDKPLIIFKDSEKLTPGIGFFTAARDNSKPFPGLSIALNDRGQLSVRWPKVADAKLYQVEISQMRQGSIEPLAKAATEKQSIQFDQVSLQSNNRYLWKLTGSTIAGKNFEANGGFVISNLH